MQQKENLPPDFSSASIEKIVELNVGGKVFMTKLSTLTSFEKSVLGQLFMGKEGDLKENKRDLIQDSKGRFFIDADPYLFRYILDFMRSKKVILPENFKETERLIQEAYWFNLPEFVSELNGGTAHSDNTRSLQIDDDAGTPMRHSLKNHRAEKDQIEKQLAQIEGRGVADYNSGANDGSNQIDASKAGFITLGYRGTFASGRGDLADVKFRKLNRILVCGRVSLCREAFGETLNESRDPDKGTDDRYSARLFLKHTSIERAFESLTSAGFMLLSSAGTSAAPGGPEGGSRRASLVPPGSIQQSPRNSKKNAQLALPADEMSSLSWDHYNEFYFQRK